MNDEFAMRDANLSALDREDRHLVGTRQRNCIVLVMGDEPRALSETLEIVQRRISSHPE